MPSHSTSRTKVWRLVGEGYDGAATFAGVWTGVRRRIMPRMQLASVQAAQSVEALKDIWYHDQLVEVVPLLSNRPNR